MGDSVRISEIKSLTGLAPLPGQYRLIHNGKPVKASDINDYVFEFAEPLTKGAYRLEVHVKINGNYIPWIYSNPIYLY